MTGVTPRNGEELAQSEVECREGKPPHVRVLFCPWDMLLRLAEQTCVRQRKPRLLGMATFDGAYRLEVRGTIGYDIGSPDPSLGALVQKQSASPRKTADNLWLIRGYRRALPPVPSCSSPPHHLDKNTASNVQHNRPVCALYPS